MINKSNIDSSVVNQSINVREPNRTFINAQNTEINKNDTIQNLNVSNDNVSKATKVNGIEETEKPKDIVESDDTLEEAFNTVSEFINVYNRNVSFSKDEESDATVIQIFDSDTQELIRQFPSEELVDLANKISELNKDLNLPSGVFFDEKV